MIRFLLAILLLCGTPASAQQFYASHNGNVLLNLGVADTGEYPFVNMMKACTNLSPSAAFAFPAQLTVDSYPISGTSFASDLSCGFPTLPTLPGGVNWVIEWPKQGAVDQVGKVSLSRAGWTFTTVSDTGSCASGSGTTSYTVTGTNCRVVLSISGSGGLSFTLALKAATTFTNFTNLIFTRTDQESAALAGCDIPTGNNCFNPDFLAVIQGTGKPNPAVIRHLDWTYFPASNGNNNLTSYGLLQGVNAISYATPFYWNPNRWGGNVCAQTTTGSCSGIGSGSNDIYVGGCEAAGCPVSYQQGETYQGFIVDANTSATPTLNVGGRGAVTIVNQNSGSNVAGVHQLSAGDIGANTFATFTYDSVLNKWMHAVQGLRVGVPIPIAVALCNKLNVDCWINIPAMLDDASVTSFAQAVCTNLKSNLKWYAEYGNELWNFANTQTNWLVARGTVWGFPTGNNRNIFDPASLRRYQVMQLVTPAWTGAGCASNKLVRVEAHQRMLTGDVNTEKYRWLGTDLTLDASGNYTTGMGGAGSGLPVVTNYSNVTVGGVASQGYPIATNIDISSNAPYMDGSQITSGSAACGVGVNTDGCYQNTMTLALSAADGCPSGPSSCTAAALQFLDADVRAGTRDAGSGPVLGANTLSNMNTNNFTTENTLANKYGIKVIWYEGGFQEVAPTAAALTTLATRGSYTTCGGGVAATCAQQFADLITAWKQSDLARQFMVDMYNQFMAQSNSLMPAFFSLGPDNTQWGLIPGPDIASTPYRTYDGISQFTHAP